MRELRTALIALPDKRLIHELLTDQDGEVCAVGAYGKHKGIDLSKFDPEYDTDDVGVAGGMPALVAWKVVEINDMEFHSGFTPEERYRGLLAWVESKLSPQSANEQLAQPVESAEKSADQKGKDKEGEGPRPGLLASSENASDATAPASHSPTNAHGR